MSKKKELGRYHTNKKVRQRIDKLLEDNARNVSNFGTKSKHDLVSDLNFKEAWDKIESQIKELDVQFYKSIIKQDDD